MNYSPEFKEAMLPPNNESIDMMYDGRKRENPKFCVNAVKQCRKELIFL